MSSLDDLFANTQRQTRGCVICGERVALSIGVRVHELENGRYGKRNVSRSRSFCAEHGPAFYQQLVDALDQAGAA